MGSSAASVLVVDDEVSIRETTAALLEDDYDVTQCASAELALNYLSGRRVDVICTDFRMTGMNGIELLLEAQKIHAGISGILVTAYADYPAYQSELRKVPCLILLKPYEESKLYDLVARAVQLSRMKRGASTAVAEAGRIDSSARNKV
jgi:DNA-binding NtrC family response regulator